MNTIFLQTHWNGEGQGEIEGFYKRTNHSFPNKFSIGGEVEIPLIGTSLAKMEREIGGVLKSVECRLTTSRGRVPLSELKKLNFEQVAGNHFILKTDNMIIELDRIDEQEEIIWKFSVFTDRYLFTATAGQMLSRMISIVKYELDIKHTYGIRAVG
ncbi:hypothetical protein [Bacillus infantis]|uniref:hypothetical protein n=1 Tax=Bacillus infantis TaxID=324767 RepID=UPI0020A185A0|nr:hypothetical protein [Bacillus infantis]MCP1161416.1 hypothetical protein [Bacillus infantis]